MSLDVTSGIVTVASGANAPRTVYVNASPVNLFGASGNAVTDHSGAVNVNISGGSADITALNNVRVSGSPLVLTAASGGVALPNVSSKSVLVTNLSGNSPVFMGSATDPPYSASGVFLSGASVASGFGLVIEGGTAVAIDIANPSALRIVHTTSGQLASYAVVMS